uniref:NADH-ubiquinone oxidoreductase chain 6 n=1 Tax=Augocoris gomesii TaxID=2080387 RepID=A0A2P1CML3_9HEMI|nr:NADH dehydrogenase subunit 6 [Augocoris gomesii]
MMTIMYSLLITLSIMFMMLNHPMSMGFILITQTMVIAIISGMMTTNFFFSYIIMIIMLSGALVLFIYMASVASNEKFKTSIKMMMTFIMTIIVSMMVVYNKINMIEYPNNMDKHNNMMLTKLFNSMSIYTTMMIILYLLMTMIVVSYIAKTQEGPLRMKIYEQTNT